MEANVGTLDRWIRMVGGSALIAWGMSAGKLIGLIGIVPLITGLTGYCYLYKVLGISTCKKQG